MQAAKRDLAWPLQSARCLSGRLSSSVLLIGFQRISGLVGWGSGPCGGGGGGSGGRFPGTASLERLKNLIKIKAGVNI